MRAAEKRAARHAEAARSPTWKLFLRLLAHPKADYFLSLPSNYAMMVIRRKYDAFSTDRAYENRPSCWLGPLGRWADRRVLDYPLHADLRERLGFVTEALVSEAMSRTSGERPVRFLSAPCGLCRDLLQAASELRMRGVEPEAFELHALDLDERGDVIPEARRRAKSAGVDITFYREDLFDAGGLVTRADAGPRFDVVNCIGLTAWLDLADVERLVDLFVRQLLTPDGVLIIDNFAWHQHSAMGVALEIPTRYHPPADFRKVLENAGLTIFSELTTSRGVNTLTIAHCRGGQRDRQ